VEVQKLTARVRYLLIFFTVALALSGLTAVPLKLESDLLQVVAGEARFGTRFGIRG